MPIAIPGSCRPYGNSCASYSKGVAASLRHVRQAAGAMPRDGQDCSRLTSMRARGWPPRFHHHQAGWRDGAGVLAPDAFIVAANCVVPYRGAPHGRNPSCGGRCSFAGLRGCCCCSRSPQLPSLRLVTGMNRRRAGAGASTCMLARIVVEIRFTDLAVEEGGTAPVDNAHACMCFPVAHEGLYSPDTVNPNHQAATHPLVICVRNVHAYHAGALGSEEAGGGWSSDQGCTAIAHYHGIANPLYVRTYVSIHVYVLYHWYTGTDHRAWYEQTIDW